jgi:hypothetical protein
MLAQQDGDRIDLLAGRAARHPHPHGVVGALAFEQAGNNEPLQRLERGRIAEKPGDADQEIAEQRDFRRSSRSRAM